jgi:hypothetical protein
MSTGTSLARRVLLAIGSLPWVRAFRNNVGFGLAIRHKDSRVRQAIISACIALAERMGGSAERITFGLHPGSGDYIGWTTREIQPEDVGTKVAVFTSIEVKDGSGQPSPDQRRWRDNVRAAGGIAGIVRSEAEALALVGGKACATSGGCVKNLHSA